MRFGLKGRRVLSTIFIINILYENIIISLDHEEMEGRSEVGDTKLKLCGRSN